MTLLRKVSREIFLAFFCVCFFSLLGFAKKELDRTEAVIQYNLAAYTYREGNKDLSISEYREFVRSFSGDPKAGSAQFMIGESYFQQGKYPLAAEEFKKVIDKYSKEKNIYVNAIYRLGECNFNMGKYLNALDYFNKALKSKNLQAESLYGSALCYLAMGEKSKSKEKLLEIMRFYPGYQREAKVIIPLSLVLLEENQIQMAKDYLEKNQEEIACVYYNGVVHQKARQTINALAFFKQVVEKAPGSLWAERAVYSSGECFYQIKQYGLAYKAFEKVFKEYVDSKLRAQALYYMACSQMQLGSVNEAQIKFQQFIQDFPDDPLMPACRYLLGELALRKNDFASALANYSQVLKESDLGMDAAFKIIWCYILEKQYGEVVARAENFLNNYQWGKLSGKVNLIKGISYQKMDNFKEANQSYQSVIDHFPTTIFSEMATYLLATSYYQNQEFAQIITHVYQILKNSPTSPSLWQAESYYWVAEAYFALKQYNRARLVYDLIIQNYPYHYLIPEAQHAIASCYAKEGRYEEAKKAQEKAITLASELKKQEIGARASLETGNILFNQRNYEKAISYYDTFIGKYPQDQNVSQALYQQGVALYRLEYYIEAVKKWEKVVSNYQSTEFAPLALFQIGKTYFGMWKYKEAIQAYQLLIDAYPKSDKVLESSLQLGQCYYNAGDIDSAIMMYKKFMNAYPEDEKIPYVLEQMQTCYYRLGKKGKELSGLLKEFPKSKFAVDSYWELGAEAFNKKEYSVAREYFNKIVVDFPETDSAKKAMYYLGETNFMEQKYELAAESYQSFINNFPKDNLDLQARFRLAVSYFKGEDYLQAATAFMNFSEKYPDDPLSKDARLNIPLCYKKARRFNEAIAGYKTYIEKYPKDESVGFAYLQMGSLNEEMGNYKEAIESYEKLSDGLIEKAEAIFSIGKCYQELHLEDKVEETYKQFLGFRPATDKFRLAGLAILGEIYERKGKNSDAIVVYSDIAKNSSDPNWIATAKEKITILKGGNR